MKRYHLLVSIVVLFSFQLKAQSNLRTPTPLQLEWQKLERIAFIHFSVNTFTDREWGFGNEKPAIFNPTDLDCDQWVKTLKDAGIQMIILTAKHHDGFCLWPSKYTEHSVKNSPWKNGQGDVVREFADACKKYDVKMGLYLSPWDCNHPNYGKPEYVTYFHNQLRELLTQYGEIAEIWFDGANGGRGYYGTDSLHKRSIPKGYYQWYKTVAITRELQPHCIIHGGGIADIRWVGNEDGYAGTTHWSTVLPYEERPTNNSRIELNVGHEYGNSWMPSETDVSIRPGWYYHQSEDHKLKSLATLMKIYYESVGRNSVLLLNVPPNKKGRIHPLDSVRLLQWHQQIQKELENPISMQVTHAVQKPTITYGEGSTIWKDTLTVDFNKEISFNRLILQEDISLGQKVKNFEVSYYKNNTWNNIDTQTTIGYKRILCYPEITTSKVRIMLTAKDTPIVSATFYHAPILLETPIIKRDKQGMVTITASDPNSTIDYKINNGKNIRYTQPFKADGKVNIEAIAYGKNETTSPKTTRTFNTSKTNWVVATDNKAGDILFDEQTNRFWESPKNERLVIVDFSKPIVINALNYTPDQSRNPKGIAKTYVISVSDDNTNWTIIDKGEFSNIENNPIEQVIPFSKPIKTRYIKFEAPQTIRNTNTLCISELDFEVK